jgi:hypothetical protein
MPREDVARQLRGIRRLAGGIGVLLLITGGVNLWLFLAFGAHLSLGLVIAAGLLSVWAGVLWWLTGRFR